MDADFSSTSITPDNLLVGDAHEEPAVLLSGENVVRGALLGKVTASGKFALSLAAATDGSETPRAIAVEDCDASLADAACLVYLEGVFNEDAVTYGTGHTAASVKQGLWDYNIYLQTPVTATPA